MEKTEAERTRLIELVKSLEIKLNSVEQSATEEQWSQRQKAATLEAERVAFEREKTFTREKFAADEKRIQVNCFSKGPSGILHFSIPSGFQFDSDYLDNYEQDIKLKLSNDLL